MTTTRELNLARVGLLMLTLACATPARPSLGAQELPAPVTAGPPLAPFAALRVAVLPVQLFKADTAAWSRALDWSSTRLALDSAITAELQARGLGKRWAYSGDVARSAKRNPTYATDPYALGVGRWRTTAPKAADQVPMIVADNLRPLTALGDTRYALIPVELRAEGARVILRLVLADTRARVVVWAGDLVTVGGATLLDSVSKSVADLVLEP